MSTPNDTVFIYVLQRISDKAYLYVGSAKNPRRRFYHHRNENPYLAIREAFAHDDIRFVVITQTDDIHRIEIEAKLWRQFKDAGHPIVNRDPAIVWPKRWDGLGTHLSPEIRAKISKSRIGIQPWNKGKRGTKRTAETCAKMSAGMKGKPSWMKGRKTSPETAAKISAAKKGKSRKPFTPEHRANLSKANKGKSTGPLSEETKRRMSEAAIARHAKGKVQDN